jgi:hypothetical protein
VQPLENPLKKSLMQNEPLVPAAMRVQQLGFRVSSAQSAFTLQIFTFPVAGQVVGMFVTHVALQALVPLVSGQDGGVPSPSAMSAQQYLPDGVQSAGFAQVKGGVVSTGPVSGVIVSGVVSIGASSPASASAATPGAVVNSGDEQATRLPSTNTNERRTDCMGLTDASVAP